MDSAKEEMSSSLPSSPSEFEGTAMNPATTRDPRSGPVCEPLPNLNIQDNSASIDHYVLFIIKLKTPDVLEAAAAQAMQVLESLKRNFSSRIGTNEDAASWTQAIEKLISQKKQHRIVVGVAGNTGAGKSSVINALLDEERLVPTNCISACTAVVSEMSWNESTEASFRSRAKVIFISRAEWEQDLTVIMQELLSENGTFLREAEDPNSDAGIAWAEFYAEYPLIDKDKLHENTISGLLSKSCVSDVLGTTKEIHAARPEEFYLEFQKYVDSKETLSNEGRGRKKK
jgi:hypothetical protein